MMYQLRYAPIIAESHKFASMVFYCPLTGLPFKAHAEIVSQHGGRKFVQVKCKHCDAAGHIKGDRAYDPNNPQIHVVEVDA